MSTKSKSQLQKELKELQQEKELLLTSRTEAPSAFTNEQQARLDEVAELIIDLEEQIELIGDDAVSNGYKPAPGTERLVHLSIIRGRRFDENTGKELSTPYKQMFTYGEYLNFKKSAPLLGYTIVEELYNPYKK